jgi:predicted TIM-barrel fold metal-dependent hydrolase
MTTKPYRFNSADTHLDLKWMPEDLWTKRLPKKFQELAPRVVVQDNGKAQWTWEGKNHGESAIGGADSQDFSGSVFARAGIHLEPGTLPPSNPGVLIEHMDVAQIWAAAIYGPTRKPLFSDLELGDACNSAYNDFLLEMNKTEPNRIMALLNLPNQSIEKTIIEAKRIAALGIVKGVEFSIYTAEEPIWHPRWEPLWSILEESRIVLNFHIGGKAGEPYPPKENGRYPAHFCYSPFATQTAMAQIVFSGVLDRHPNLKIIFGECRVGWLPFFIEHMDRQARERPTDIKLEMRPSEYWKRQMAASFEDDVIGAKLLADPESHLQYMVVWGSDYPHNPISWPGTADLMSWLMKDVPEDVYFDAVYGRVAKFFELKDPPGLIRSKPIIHAKAS